MGWANSSVLLQNQSLHLVCTNTVCCQKSGVFNNVSLIMDQLEPPHKLDLLMWQKTGETGYKGCTVLYGNKESEFPIVSAGCGAGSGGGVTKIFKSFQLEKESDN